MQKNDAFKTASDSHNRAQSIPVNRKSLKRPSKKKITVEESTSKKVEVTEISQKEIVAPETRSISKEIIVTGIQSTPKKTTTLEVKTPEAKTQLEVKIQSEAETQPEVKIQSRSKNNVNIAKVNSRMKARSMVATPTTRPSAKELKEQAIKKALASAANHTPEKKEKTRLHFGVGRMLLALSCASVVVFAIVYFVNLNMPDMSLKVAAMQTGINATYPSCVPDGFSITSISSEDGKIALSFHNENSDDNFVLEEEESSWDSGALLTNYVKKEFNADYSSVREDGLTIYIDDSHAAWVNGGIVYKIKIISGTLTKKQIRKIAVSAK